MHISEQHAYQHGTCFFGQLRDYLCDIGHFSKADDSCMYSRLGLSPQKAIRWASCWSSTFEYGKWQIVRTEHVINGCIYVAPEIATATATPSSVASSVGSILIS